jgi:hypothetical protein
MSFQRSNRTVNTCKTVARKQLRRSVTTPSVMPVRVLVHVEGYASVVTPSFNPVHVDSSDVYRKYDGKRRGGTWNDTSR